MGKIFQLTEKYLPPPDPQNVFVEIGSDRWEGSTEYFATLAVANSTVLHTVDIDKEAQYRLAHVPGITWHIDIGSAWSKTVFPTTNKKISCLYLDNFDYIWDTKNIDEMIQKQQHQYRQNFGLSMDNQSCQIEHFQQMQNLYPYMSEHSVVVLDDTYQINDCWVGKSGPVVIFLLANGYTIKETTTDCGVILTRGCIA